MRECAAREFGCSCTDHCQSYNAELERRIQNLGTVRKARPAPHNNTTRWQYAMVFLFAVGCIAYGATHGFQEQQRMDRIAQEMGR